MKNKYPKLMDGNEWSETEKLIWDMYYLSREHVKILRVLLLISIFLNGYLTFRK